ncbi:MAG: glycoside hydrolase family 2 TIM barrel-domain containing protein [Faecousia sp.]
MNQRFSFNNGWKFVREDIPQAVQPGYPAGELARWADVSLPHTPRYEPYDNHGIPTFQGRVMYRKHFPVEEAFAGKQVFLEFEAVMGVCNVWLNGNLLHTHFADAAPDKDGIVHTNYGGYLPFVVELTPFLRYEEDNVLVVWADNTDAPQVPPGKPQALLDFTYFGGIYRNVWLNICEQVHITDPLFEDLEGGGGVVFETLSVSSTRADAQARVHIRNNAGLPQNIQLRVELTAPGGETACEALRSLEIGALSDTTEEVTLTVPDPQLWNLETPYLYALTCSLVQAGSILHTHTERVGLRRITVSRQSGVCINGIRAPLLSGVNRHQDFPLLGNAAPASLQRRDALLYRSAGFHVVRAAHYPMSVDFVSACDELGILLIEATPGWQWYPSGDDQPFTSRVLNNIRQMVRRDRNHPCILAYETVLNETYHVPYGYNRRMAQTALRESGDARIASESYGYDASPQANGIDELSDFIYGFEQPLEKTQKAVMFLREYGDSWQEAYGIRMSRRVTRGNTGGIYPGGEQENLRKANKLLFVRCDDAYTLADRWAAYRESPAFAGCAIWTGIDSRGMWSAISPCGIWDAFRIPKTACYALESQRPARKNPMLEALGVQTGPVLHIADSWLPGRDFRDVYVYSNAARVELQVVQEETVRFQQSALPMNTGWCPSLPHPPFLFENVPYYPGSHLYAKAFSQDGTVLTQTTVYSPGKPHRIVLEIAQTGSPFWADGSDIVTVYARIVDARGTLCPDAEVPVFFTAGPGVQIVGDGDCFAAGNPARAEAGIASVFLRAGTQPGSVQLQAVSPGLQSGSIALTLAPAPLPQFPFTPLPQGKPRFSFSYNLADKCSGGALSQTVFRQGVLYPNSLLLSKTAFFSLEQRYTRLYGKLSLRRGSSLSVFADQKQIAAFRRSGPLCLDVSGARVLTMEASGECTLLSPYLSDEPRCSQETRRNIALRKKATASSNPGDAQNVFKKGYLWETMWIGEKIQDQPEYFQLDLGRHYDVRDAMVYIGGQMGSDCTNYTYEIQTSEDGAHWDTKCHVRRTSWSNGVIDRFYSPGTRYLRVVFIQVDGGLLPAISKLEVYGDTCASCRYFSNRNIKGKDEIL